MKKTLQTLDFDVGIGVSKLTFDVTVINSPIKTKKFTKIFTCFNNVHQLACYLWSSPI